MRKICSDRVNQHSSEEIESTLCYAEKKLENVDGIMEMRYEKVLLLHICDVEKPKSPENKRTRKFTFVSVKRKSTHPKS